MAYPSAQPANLREPGGAQTLYAPGDEIGEARMVLHRELTTPETAALGRVAVREDIESSIGPFLHVPEYVQEYPEVVTEALGELYAEYNSAFTPLVEANREWSTDYQYAFAEEMPLNRWVQIDMVGLPQGFLDQAAELGRPVVREVLRGSIFEIENSLANYQLLERIHSHRENGEPTHFARHFRASLDALRHTYGKKVALLAVTDEKYQAVKETEFGKTGDQELTDDEVRRLSGFDTFFSPSAFADHVRQEGDSDYLLYVRSSDPVAKLRDPRIEVVHTLLADDAMRRVIKAHAITLNIDNPAWPDDSPARINDTKAYLSPMGMAYEAADFDDIYATHEQSDGSLTYTLNPELEDYLRSQGIETESETAQPVYAKPMRAAYGCYGHVPNIAKHSGRRKLKRGLQERGTYVIQPVLPTPVITNTEDGQQYTYIDRNFFAVTDTADITSQTFMGGFRSLMPLQSAEAEKGRVHGNSSLVWAEIQ